MDGLLLVGGFALCFLGRSWLRGAMVLAGFTFGLSCAHAIVCAASLQDKLLTLSLMIVGGIFGSLLLAFVYPVAVLVLSGSLIYLAIGLLSPSHTLVELAAVLVAACCIGLAMRGITVVVSTAIWGSWLALGGAVRVFGLGVELDVLPSQHSLLGLDSSETSLVLFCWGVLAVCGTVVQLHFESRRRGAGRGRVEDGTSSHDG